MLCHIIASTSTLTTLITTLKSLDYNVVMTFRFNNDNNNNNNKTFFQFHFFPSNFIPCSTVGKTSLADDDDDDVLLYLLMHKTLCNIFRKG